MKRSSLIVLILIGVLALTNPSHAAHQQAFSEGFKAENPILSFLGVGKVASALVGYDSYVFFSVGTVADEPVSVGVFGKVFTREVPIESEIAKALRGER